METPGEKGEGGEDGERARETDILHDVLPHPQPLLLHLHHVVLLILRVVDLLQLHGETHTGVSGGCRQQVIETALLMALHLLCEERLQLLLVQEVVLVGVWRKKEEESFSGCSNQEAPGGEI